MYGPPSTRTDAMFDVASSTVTSKEVPRYFGSPALARTLDHGRPIVFIDRRVDAIRLVDVPLRELGMEALGHSVRVAVEPGLVVVARGLFNRE